MFTVEYLHYLSCLRALHGADSSSMANNQLEVVKCSICDDPYDANSRTPLVLKCGHTFCKRCITQGFQQKGFIQCFVDRLREDRSLSHLPTNFALVDAARLDVAAAAMLRGLNINQRILLDERNLQLTDRSLGSGGFGTVVEGLYNDRPVSGIQQ